MVTKTVPVNAVEEIYPAVTTSAPGGTRPQSGVDGDESPVVTNVLANVLGWRPRKEDPAAFDSALRARFHRTFSEGVYDVSYVPGAHSMQAQTGAITGGQAALWTLARAIRDQAALIVNSLTPLIPDPLTENCESLRTMVRDTLDALCDEFGMVGGPRVARVDSQFQVLLGWRPGGVTQYDITSVGGVLGELRDAFGLTPDNSYTIDDEATLSDGNTLVSLFGPLLKNYVEQRAGFLSPNQGTAGYMGTKLVWVDRLLAAVDEQLTVLEQRLDSVGVPEPVRQTVDLPTGGMSLGGFFGWIHSFLRKDAKDALDGGKLGIQTAFAPTVYYLYELFWTNFNRNERLTAYEILLPLNRDLPSGFGAGRVCIAVDDLRLLMRELLDLASTIHVEPHLVAMEPLFTAVDGDNQLVDVSVAVSGMDLAKAKPLVQLLPDGGVALDPESATKVANDRVSARFDLAKLAGMPGPRTLRMQLTAPKRPNARRQPRYILDTGHIVNSG